MIELLMRDPERWSEICDETGFLSSSLLDRILVKENVLGLEVTIEDNLEFPFLTVDEGGFILVTSLD